MTTTARQLVADLARQAMRHRAVAYDRTLSSAERDAHTAEAARCDAEARRLYGELPGEAGR